ncbi:MAG: magnesium transporter [Parachlamydiaceae bacterium]|nr:magnesium transporter [Parachlamydiaceae bacterium]
MQNSQHSDGIQVKTLDAIEIADIITQTYGDKQLAMFNQLSKDLAIKVFEYLPFPNQELILRSLETEEVKYLLNGMSPDDRTAFFESLPPQTIKDYLKLLPPQERSIAASLLGYPKDSIGRLMTTDYIAVKIDWSVEQVLEYIRKFGRDSETVSFIYVVNEEYQLIDDIRIREFLFAPLNAKVRDLADSKFVALSVNESDEESVKEFSKYERSALPVVDEEGKLLGIVTFDDVLDLINQEITEDIQKIGGTAALEYPYLQVPFFELMRKRGGWLVVLFLGEMLTATAMGYFEAEISKATVLALFIPLIISSGGNSGSQASTLIIRALAVGDVYLKDWWKIIHREIFSGLFLGSLLGSIGFLQISVWSTFTTIYGPHWFLLATTIFISLIGVILWGTLAGSVLPLILKRYNFDPAVASAPLVATMVDVTGIIIYFITAMIILQGTLL